MTNSIYSEHTYSYLTLRKAVGWIGILMPVALILGGKLIFFEPVIQPSISHYYHTGMRNVLVGALCAVALFLFFYSGYSPLDNWAGNLAGIAAIGVAWFPTTESGPTDPVGKIHFISALIFFLTLAFYSLFLFTKKAPDPTPRKLTRNKIYVICGVIIQICMLAISLYFRFFEQSYPESAFVFWAETVALLAFGLSWLTKGETLYPDKKTAS